MLAALGWSDLAGLSGIWCACPCDRRFSSRPNAASGQQYIDSATGAQVEHRFAGVQLRQGGGVSTPEGGPQGLFAPVISPILRQHSIPSW